MILFVGCARAKLIRTNIMSPTPIPLCNNPREMVIVFTFMLALLLESGCRLLDGDVAPRKMPVPIMLA